MMRQLSAILRGKNAARQARLMRRICLALWPALFCFGMAAQAQNAPQPKPRKPKAVKSAAAPRPSASPFSAAAPFAPGRHLGVIKENTPLIIPPQSPFAPSDTAPLLRRPAPFSGEKASPPAAAPAPGIGNYPLNEAVLVRLEKIRKEIMALPEPIDDGDDDAIAGGVDVLVKALEKRPDVMGILGRNLMSAPDYVIAMQAVSAALAAAEEIDDGRAKISDANLAFGKTYADRIRALLEE